MSLQFASLNGTTSAEAKSKILADPKGAKFDIQYFRIAGGGITPRDLLAYGGVDWKNSYADAWPAEKTSTPFGVLPMLTIDKGEEGKVVLSESGVIDQYLAKQFGLLGDNEWEEQYVRMLYSSSSYIIERVSTRYTWNFESAKAESLALLQTSLLPEWIAAHETYLKENGNNGHYLGNKLSLADIRTASVLKHWSHQPQSEQFLGLIKPDSPLWKVQEAVENSPGIKAWRASEECKSLDANSLVMYASIALPKSK